MKLNHWILIFASAIALSSCTTFASQQSSTQNPECVQRYDSVVDYFPNKVRLVEAKGFTVEYHKHYKVVTVNRPWKEAKTQFRYVLVQCGTPTPPGFSDSQVVQVPVRSLVALSTTHLVPLQKLGVLDRLVGVSDFDSINTPAVVEKIKAKQLQQVGNVSSLNIEKILEISPDLITTFGTGNPQRDAHPKLLEANLKVGIVAEYMESTPLGQAEWIKFLALFFNREAEAERSFAKTIDQYRAIAAKAKAVSNKPIVFSGSNHKGIWYVPGGDSYVAKFFKDAGATYVWAGDRTTGSLPLNFEQVYDRAADATYWLNASHGSGAKTLKSLTAMDDRYGKFAAVRLGNVFNPIAATNGKGGNDYWESGVANPDVVLTDLVKIFHPQLVPDHQFVYYQQLPR